MHCGLGCLNPADASAEPWEGATKGKICCMFCRVKVKQIWFNMYNKLSNQIHEIVKQ